VFTDIAQQQIAKGEKLMNAKLNDTINNLLCNLSQIITKACQVLI
jgi:hypothetical protein